MSTTLFVGNLSPATDEHQLKELFAAHGRVTDVDLIVDRSSGRSRGIAYRDAAGAAVLDARALEGVDVRSLFWLRTCSSFQGARGHRLAGVGHPDARAAGRRQGVLEQVLLQRRHGRGSHL